MQGQKYEKDRKEKEKTNKFLKKKEKQIEK